MSNCRTCAYFNVELRGADRGFCEKTCRDNGDTRYISLDVANWESGCPKFALKDKDIQIVENLAGVWSNVSGP
jgi:hypothetical protein